MNAGQGKHGPGSKSVSKHALGTCRHALCAWSLFLAALFFLVVETDGRAPTPITAYRQKLQRRALLQSTTGVAEPLDCSTIRKIAIVGERHSGTNLAEKLLLRNLDQRHISVSGGLTAHKHWMQPDPRSANDTCGVLLVLPVRNPYDWAQALHRTCYCCGGMQYLTFEQFVKAPYQPQNAHDSHGEHCQTDVNIANNKTFENVITMRETKVNSSLSLARKWYLPVEVVRWEDMLYPEMQVSWVKHLSAKYKLPLAPPRPPGCMGFPGVTPDECRAAEAAFAATSGRKQPSQSATLGVWAIARSVQAESFGQQQHLLPQQQLQIQQGQRQREFGGHRMAGNARTMEGGGHSARTLIDVPASAGSRDTLASASSQSSLPGHEQAPGVQPITEDARDFVNNAFSTKGRVISSTYFNLPMVLSNGVLRSKVQAVNEVLDAEFEASLGYHRIDV